MIAKRNLASLKSDKIELFNSISSSQLVLFGDDHNTDSGRIWIRDNLEELSYNRKNLGLEYIPSSDEKYINHIDLLKIHLDSNYKEFPGFHIDSVINIIMEAQRQKLRVFGIDMPSDYFKDWTDSLNQKERTKYMSENILKNLEEGKTMALLGADHVENKTDNVYGMISERSPNIKVLSIVFAGGKDWTVDTEDYWIRQVDITAKDIGWDKETIFMKNQNDLLPCDWVIHFPQI